MEKRLYQLILHANNSDKHLSYNSQWFFKPSLYHEIQNAYKFLSKYSEGMSDSSLINKPNKYNKLVFTNSNISNIITLGDFIWI